MQALLGRRSFAIIFLANAAHAQTNAAISNPLDRATQEGLRRLDEQDRQQQQRLQPTGTELKPDALAREDAAIPVDAPCFAIDHIELIGHGSPYFQWLIGETKMYLHQCLGSSALRQMVGRLNQNLLVYGYSTTKVALGPQNLRTGTLSLQLEAGYVSEMVMVQETLAGRQPDLSWGTFKNAMPVAVGDLLNIHAIEQGLEQMKRLSSQQVNTLIQPGETPGTSRIEIVRNPTGWRDRIHAGISIDNSGNSVMGRALMSSYLVFDNPLGLNDLLNLSGSSNLNQPTLQHRSQSFNAAYSVPWGYNTLSLSYSHARFAQKIMGTTATYLSSGGSDISEIRLARTFWRSGSFKWGGFAALSGRTADSFINDVELVVQRRRVTNATLGVNAKKLLASATVDGELNFRRGTTLFRAEDDLTLRDPSGPTLRPRIFTVALSLTTPIKMGTQVPTDYSVAWRFQHSADKSLSIDQLGIGSRYTVRGFDGAGVLLGESGYTLRQDFVRAVPGLINGAETKAYLALDAGRVWGPSTDGSKSQKLLGLALGMRAKQGQLNADISVGTPVYRPSHMTGGRLNLYASLSYQF